MAETARRRRSRGEGHVNSYMTKRGERFYWKATLAQPDGTRKVTWKRGFTTKKAAQDALREALVDAKKGTWTEPSKRTVASWVAEWLSGLRLAKSTVSSYQRSIRLHVLPYIGQVPLAELTSARLDTMYRRLEAGGRAGYKAGQPLSARTVRYVHQILSAALARAVENGLLARNPAARAHPPTAKQAASPEIHPWNAAQLSAFLGWAAGNSTHYAAWRLLAFTGMRRGEMLSLRWRDIGLDAGTVAIRRSVGVVHVKGEPGRVIEGQTKTARPRVVSLDAATVELLRTWRWERELLAPELAADSALVFSDLEGRHLHPERFSRTFSDTQRRCRAALGAAAPPPARLHDLRHTHATLLLASGMPVKVVSERLGHASVVITLTTYGHVMPGDQQRAADRFAALVGGQP